MLRTAILVAVSLTLSTLPGALPPLGQAGVEERPSGQRHPQRAESAIVHLHLRNPEDGIGLGLVRTLVASALSTRGAPWSLDTERAGDEHGKEITAPPPYSRVLNWFDELKRHAPTDP